MAALVIVATLGCDGGRPAASRVAARSRLQALQGKQQNALFNSIRSQLRTLPEETQTDLRPPTVVLDSRSSADGEDVEAVLVRRPDALDEPPNLLINQKGNGRFRSLVRPGDIIKYFVLPDRDTRDRFREGGEVDIVTFDSIELVVAQVISDQALLIEGGLPAEVTIDRKVEVWRYVDDRMDEIQRRWTAYVKRRDPPLGWQPSPDEAAIRQLTERLNQWLRQARTAAGSAESPTEGTGRPALLETLPEALASDEKLATYLAAENLADGYFEAYEARQVQGATWRRDVARWARGADAAPLAIAASLFDWTVRHVQLIEPDDATPRWPWELMLHGRATAEGRAWVFAGLCRQQNLTAAAVTVEQADGASRTLVGVLDDGRLYVFDPQLGLPLPGAEPGSIATLSKLSEDDGLLRRLDLPDSPYPVTAESLASASVGVVASPLELTARAARLSKRLTGDDAVALATPVDEVAQRLAAAAGSRPVVLWAWPYETLLRKLTAKPAERRRAVRDFLPLAWRPHLWKGRLLSFRGLVEDPDAPRDVLAEAVNDHRAARNEYMHRTVRPKDSLLAEVAGEKREIYRDAKTLATLWLATISYDEGAHEVSRRWLTNGALQGEPAADHASAVNYNLARAHEALGETEAAIELLSSSTGPQSHGDRLRAERLKATFGEAEDAEPETQAEAAAP